MARMRRPSVAEVMSLGNATQGFRWRIALSKVPNALSISDAGEILNMRAFSTSIPQRTGQSSEIMIRGSRVRQFGIADWESPWELTITAFNDMKEFDLLWEWDNICWETRNGSTGLTQNFEDVITDIDLYQLDNMDYDIAHHKLVGAYIESSTLGELSSEDSNPLQPSISFAYQYCERDIQV